MTFDKTATAYVAARLPPTIVVSTFRATGRGFVLRANVRGTDKVAAGSFVSWDGGVHQLDSIVETATRYLALHPPDTAVRESSEGPITTLDQAMSMVDNNEASCYGIKEGGRTWIGFGEVRNSSGGLVPEVSLFLPTTAAAVESCSGVQERWVKRVAQGLPLGQLPEDSPQALAPGQPKVVDIGEGPRDASAETIRAIITEACEAHPEIGELTFSGPDGCNGWEVNGQTYVALSGDTFTDHRRQAGRLAGRLSHEHKHAKRPCGVCRGAFSILCGACKGGVGT